VLTPTSVETSIQVIITILMPRAVTLRILSFNMMGSVSVSDPASES